MARAWVLGLGRSGRAAAQLLRGEGYEVIGYDDHTPADLLDMECYSRESNPPFAKEDLVVLSPGMPLRHTIVQSALSKGAEVIGEAELALRYHTGRAVGITGTNGKTTVTLMVDHILRNAGYCSMAVGNVGTPLSGSLEELRGGVAVLELSSFQLSAMHSRKLDAAAILNISEDHLDIHGSMESYARAKSHIASLLREGGCLFVQRAVQHQWGQFWGDISVVSFGIAQDCKLRWEDNWLLYKNSIECILPMDYMDTLSNVENRLAAYGLCRQLGLSPAQFAEAVASFRPPPHRRQVVRCWRDVQFVDDSKATNPASVVSAVQDARGTVRLIAGGQAKGASFVEWPLAFAGKVAKVYAIGEAAPQLLAELRGSLSVERFSDLASAVGCAAEEAQPGEWVLLSPGCASLDMFSSYAERGMEFQRVVGDL